MINCLAVLVCALAVLGPAAAQTAPNALFTAWKLDFNKTYTPEEDAARQLIFERNLRSIELHNTRNSNYKVRLH